MFRAIVASAFLLSVLTCVAYDIVLRRNIAREQKIAAERRAELQKFGDVDREVTAYRQQKDDLQRRIDAINRLKQNQKLASPALALLDSLDDEPIDSIAVIDSKTIVVNSGGSSRRMTR